MDDLSNLLSHQSGYGAGHSETPRLVLASGDVTEAFYDAAQAFNYAERYQTELTVTEEA